MEPRCRGTDGKPAAAPLAMLRVDEDANRVYLGDRLVVDSGQEVVLTALEYRLLCYLLRNRRRILTRDQILERVWGDEAVGNYHMLNSAIMRLRDKVGQDAIQTRRGIGYGIL